ncbi:MAG: sulfite exporter TauE/SafE family protein [Planctomycetota bacterium]
MFLALLGAVVIGLSLGLLGSGGSILTVPVLTFLLGMQEKVAIASSLAIVGGIALVGGLPGAYRGLVDGRSLVFFGLPGMVGAYLGAHLSKYVSGTVQLVVFALLMLVASVLMFRPIRLDPDAVVERRKVWKIVLDGLVVGAVTGFVGVGGGFLIVPALVLMGGLSMHRAVATSLFIIVLKSASGFFGHLHVLDELGLAIDWSVIGLFVLIGSVGSIVGNVMSKRVPQLALQRAFAVFLIVIGVAICAQSLTKHAPAEAAVAEQG